MSVYFVLRSFYEGPTAKYIRKFEEATVLEWFQKHWQLAADQEPNDAVSQWIGTEVYGFASLFEAIVEHEIAPPETESQLWDHIEANLYVEGALQCEPNLIQVLTDDDELELAYYIFDDHFLAENPGRAEFVLHEGWELPPNASNPETDDISYIEEMMLLDLDPDADHEEEALEGAVYFACLTFYDTGCLIDLEGGYALHGYRLPTFARYLLSKRDVPENALDWPRELVGVRNALVEFLTTREGMEKGFAEALLENPKDDSTWSAYSDWLQEQGRRPVGMELIEQALRYLNEKETSSFVMEGRPRHPEKSLLRIEDHLVQANLHVDYVDQEDYYHQWYFFDDLWYDAHQPLANGLLRYARRWDALDLGEPEEDEYDEFDDEDDLDEFDDDEDLDEDLDEDDLEEDDFEEDDEDESWRDNGTEESEERPS